MKGIIIDQINTAIRKNDGYYDLVNSDTKLIVGGINELNNLFSGNDLSFLFSDLINCGTGMSIIPSIVKSYSEVLSSVVSSYKAQDLNLKSQVASIISQNQYVRRK